MRRFSLVMLAFFGCAVVLLHVSAQQPETTGEKANKDYSNSNIVASVLAFDKDKCGKVTKEQVTDVRLHRLFDQADANKDSVVTRDELTALAGRIEAVFAHDDKGDKGKGGPKRKGKGGFDGKGPKGKGPGGPPQPGFFGGWLGPVLPPVAWFALKTSLFLCFFILLRAALPRPRFDQLMAFGWKAMLPLALLNLLATGGILLLFD